MNLFIEKLSDTGAREVTVREDWPVTPEQHFSTCGSWPLLGEGSNDLFAQGSPKTTFISDI